MIIDQEKNKWTYIFKGLGVLFVYLFISLFRDLPFYILNIDVDKIPEIVVIIYSFVIEILIIIGIYSIYRKEFKLAFKDILNNHSDYFSKYFKVYLIGILIMILSNVLINVLGGGISSNESYIRNEFQKFPIYVFTSAVFLAPVLEESIFRLAFKSIIKNNYIFIFLSGLVFGGLHLIGTPINNLFILYLLSYCSSGFAFAYMMAKTNNVLVSTSFHIMHNGIILLLQAFFLIFT